MAESRPIVLYVEDNRSSMLLVRRLLTAEGFEVRDAASADAAFAQLKEYTPALILMDINLPAVDGYTITSRLRKLDGMRDIPIVAMTANALRGDEAKSLAAGCNGYIQKPIDVDALPGELRAFLDARGGDEIQ
jgi:two-component system cell cycle response regulator DivK